MRKLWADKSGRANVGRARTRAAASARRLRAAASFEIAQLEARLLYCVDHLSPAIDHDGNVLTHSSQAVQLTGPLASDGVAEMTLSPLASLPVLNSKSGAA